ncbi:MAG TPA: rhomboid family intramembrane serine protease [Syntrophorhabdaceae bacterium]|nr:rhomboid family intramembrane serine protease [Syntrophorhabdaceae bacterium]MDI9562114.1 rhomboid family intramembrane serine protease [Pseudomonadota bacterium]OQC49144.1 MAG: Rhomboid protease GluP [Deltaproteobacteria bacterium ADurb.Bin026]HOS59338.1 rhomboid family intramembrane serine protease [Syntrophorhabdaceae bacterium]HQG51183.1 rhomboid family intramembrane serine protease [Syntrophorhabdaceae bacterium]
MVSNSTMIPIKDNIPTKVFPIISTSIIFVNVLIFLWQRFMYSGTDNSIVYKSYGLMPHELTLALTSNHELLPYNILTIFTSMFLHGGYFHLFGNMLYIWIFGNNIEDAIGHKKFIIFYFLSGIIAALFQFLYDPQSNIPMIGASGAVSGILGAYLILFPYAKVKTVMFILIFIKVVELPAILLLSIWFFIQLLFSNGEGIAWYAHIGGFIFGLLSIRLFRPTIHPISSRKKKNVSRET